MTKTGGLPKASLQGWGDRAALKGTHFTLQDLKGNNDGLWGNEDKMAGRTGGLFARQPLTLKAKAAVAAGFSTKDEIAALESFRVEAEARWGEPTINLADPSKLRRPNLYAAQKALALSRFDRKPSEVKDEVVRASGKVDGQAIEARDVFTQLWSAKGPPSGRVVVLSPGFQETWRDFVEVIDELNAKGHDVVVMDHQWGSEVGSARGGIDRGFGVARDVASVTARAAQIAKERYGDEGSVILAGNSMGAGPGAFGAAQMNALGLIELDGPPMPKNLPVALFDPFFGATKNAMNTLIGAASRLPIMNEVELWAAGQPDLTDDRVAEQKGAQNAVLADTRARLSSMAKALPDLARMQALAGGPAQFGPTIVVHAKNDPLADPGRAKAVAAAIGAEYRELDNGNHVHQLSPKDQTALVDAIDALARG